MLPERQIRPDPFLHEPLQYGQILRERSVCSRCQEHPDGHNRLAPLLLLFALSLFDRQETESTPVRMT